MTDIHLFSRWCSIFLPFSYHERSKQIYQPCVRSYRRHFSAPSELANKHRFSSRWSLLSGERSTVWSLGYMGYNLLTNLLLASWDTQVVEVPKNSWFFSYIRKKNWKPKHPGFFNGLLSIWFLIPNLYHGENGWKSPFSSFKKIVVYGSRWPFSKASWHLAETWVTSLTIFHENLLLKKRLTAWYAFGHTLHIARDYTLQKQLLTTWRITPVVTPIYKPFRPFGRGTTP